MVDILALLPAASVSGVIWTLVKALIVFVAIVISDKVIAHEIEIKHALLMSIAAYFLIPIVVAAILIIQVISYPFNLALAWILPLIVWIILGEVVLHGADRKAKLGIAVVAFIVYVIVDFFGASTGIPQMISSVIPF